MEWIEKEVNEDLKWVCIYIEGLEFATLVPITADSQTIADERWVELQEDYAEWGDYLHSHLAIEKYLEEDGTSNS